MTMMLISLSSWLCLTHLWWPPVLNSEMCFLLFHGKYMTSKCSLCSCVNTSARDDLFSRPSLTLPPQLVLVSLSETTDQCNIYVASKSTCSGTRSFRSVLSNCTSVMNSEGWELPTFSVFKKEAVFFELKTPRCCLPNVSKDVESVLRKILFALARKKQIKMRRWILGGGASPLPSPPG